MIKAAKTVSGETETILTKQFAPNSKEKELKD
jgi:hypothetical protein